MKTGHNFAGTVHNIGLYETAGRNDICFGVP